MQPYLTEVYLYVLYLFFNLSEVVPVRLLDFDKTICPSPFNLLFENKRKFINKILNMT